jgi:hypothetical protein
MHHDQHVMLCRAWFGVQTQAGAAAGSDRGLDLEKRNYRPIHAGESATGVINARGDQRKPWRNRIGFVLNVSHEPILLLMPPPRIGRIAASCGPMIRRWDDSVWIAEILSAI